MDDHMPCQTASAAATRTAWTYPYGLVHQGRFRADADTFRRTGSRPGTVLLGSGQFRRQADDIGKPQQLSLVRQEVRRFRVRLGRVVVVPVRPQGRHPHHGTGPLPRRTHHGRGQPVRPGQGGSWLQGVRQLVQRAGMGVHELPVGQHRGQRLVGRPGLAGTRLSHHEDEAARYGGLLEPGAKAAPVEIIVPRHIGGQLAFRVRDVEGLTHAQMPGMGLRDPPPGARIRAQCGAPTVTAMSPAAVRRREHHPAARIDLRITVTSDPTRTVPIA
ncbi:hypothetical protein BFF78_41155 [Streptomyces fodineus]|uniref:Uncharacterized protein n=1 Tax=Streptomyces fodineus TaxID=1904616 RepID=A0A1D7YM34_9ACTN|nr:hypothetical protein BFF78_41155 [Streptomyces fodineus]